MATIIRNRKLEQDIWLRLEHAGEAAEADLPSAGDIIVPLDLWEARRGELLGHPGRLGLWLDTSQALESIADDLAGFALIAIRFPKFTDGRGYSIARVLRDRYGYRGELRAIGDVQRDQLLYLERCGFDSFELKEGRDAQAALSAFADFSEAYQSAVDQPQPLFRRRAAAAGKGLS